MSAAQHAGHLARALAADGGWWGPPLVERWAASRKLDADQVTDVIELLGREGRAVIRQWDGIRQVRAVQGARARR